MRKSRPREGMYLNAVDRLCDGLSGLTIRDVQGGRQETIYCTGCGVNPLAPCGELASPPAPARSRAPKPGSCPSLVLRAGSRPQAQREAHAREEPSSAVSGGSPAPPFPAGSGSGVTRSPEFLRLLLRAALSTLGCWWLDVGPLWWGRREGRQDVGVQGRF